MTVAVAIKRAVINFISSFHRHKRQSKQNLLFIYFIQLVFVFRRGLIHLPAYTHTHTFQRATAKTISFIPKLNNILLFLDICGVD
jgi:hypothetical protein